MRARKKTMNHKALHFSVVGENRASRRAPRK
jgi:hypothetical protein